MHTAEIFMHIAGFFFVYTAELLMQAAEFLDVYHKVIRP